MSTDFVTGPPDVPPPAVRIRAALPRDVNAIRDLVEPYAQRRILLAKELVGYYEAVQEFVVAEEAAAGTTEERVGGPGGAAARESGRVVGCGALHVMWADLAEVRTLAVAPQARRRGVGHGVLDALLQRARDLGLRRVFCLTFEVDFFAAHGFAPIEGTPVDAEVYAQLLRSHDDGVAEFLDLARVKPNTLGNTRMLLEL
nr:amino-acid N-acetyltransferase [uncultured Actinotalea sp.]